MAKKKKTVTPVIMGIHPQGERKKKLMTLDVGVCLLVNPIVTNTMGIV